MNAPVTKLDQRFSSRDAKAIGWEETRGALEAAELFWLSSVRADGRPHVTPLVAVWLDDALYFHTGAHEQKYVNLGTNQHVVLTTGCNRWDRGFDVVVEGEATAVTDDAVLERLAAVWAGKRDGRWQLTARDGCFYHGDSEEDGTSQVFEVRPVRAFTHAKGDPFGATTHRF